MKYLATTIAALSLALPAGRRADTAPDLRTSVDSLVSSRAAADEFSGVILVARGTSIVYERAVGLANRELGTPMTMDTRLQIASATKLFTQIAIRQLDQAGKLLLSDTVGKFLPNYPNATVRSKATIEMLLKHRSGIGSFWNDKFLANVGNVRSINDYLELFKNDSLLFEPGTSDAYSNGGFVVLGAIIERVSGMSYHDYVRERIFKPAGMTATMPYDRRVSMEHAAIGYTSQPLEFAPGADRRLAGQGPRPGYEQGGAPALGRAGDSSAASTGAQRMRIVGPDGRQLSPDQARDAMARRASSGAPRRPNTSVQAGLSGPAGDHFSSAGDFMRLADALLQHRLLDSAHTAAVLGTRYSSGQDFRANGGGPGVNAEFSIFPSGEVMIVLANYDPPSATNVAQFIRSIVAPAASR